MSIDIISLVVSLIVVVPLYLWTSLAAVAVFRKAGVETWPAWVPIYNVWVLCTLAGITPWLSLLCLVPPLIPIVFLVVGIQLSPRFGLSPAWCALAAVCPPAYLTLLGWGDAHWEGPRREDTAVPQHVSSPRPDLDWLSNPSAGVWNGVSDATEIAPVSAPASGLPGVGEPFSDTVRADVPAAGWGQAAPAAPSSPAYPPAPPLTVNLPDPIVAEQTPDWRNLFASSADRTPVSSQETPASAVPASLTEAPYIPEPATPAPTAGLAPSFFEYASEPPVAPQPVASTNAPYGEVLPPATPPFGGVQPAAAPSPFGASLAPAPTSDVSGEPQGPVPTSPFHGVQPAAAPSPFGAAEPTVTPPFEAPQPVSAPYPSAPESPIAATPSAPTPWEQTPSWGTTPQEAPREKAADPAPPAPAPALERGAWAPPATPPSFAPDAADPAPAEPSAFAPPATAQNLSTDPHDVRAPAQAGATHAPDAQPGTSAIRMREDSEVIAEARARAVTPPYDAAVPAAAPVTGDTDDSYPPIVIPGPAAPPMAPDAPFAPAIQRDAAPSEFSESMLDFSQEVSAVVGAPDAGAPRAARQAVAAQAEGALVTPMSDGDDFEATEIASRRRPIWTITPPLGGEIVLTAESAVLGRRPSDADARVQNIPVADGTRTVSKTHARLDLIDGVWWITDLGSTNGVFLIDENGTEQELSSGVPAALTERFLLGDAELRISRASS